MGIGRVATTIFGHPLGVYCGGIAVSFGRYPPKQLLLQTDIVTRLILPLPKSAGPQTRPNHVDVVMGEAGAHYAVQCVFPSGHSKPTRTMKEGKCM